MEILKNLTQQKLCEILMEIMIKGNESKDINLNDLVDEIKQQVLTAMK